MTMLTEPHALKCWPELFKQLWCGEKEFEYRRNDRNFYEGDILFIREYYPSRKKYSGRYVKAIVKKIWGAGWSHMPELPATHVIMQIMVYDWVRSDWKTEGQKGDIK